MFSAHTHSKREFNTATIFELFWLCNVFAKIPCQTIKFVRLKTIVKMFELESIRTIDVDSEYIVKKLYFNLSLIKDILFKHESYSNNFISNTLLSYTFFEFFIWTFLNRSLSEQFFEHILIEQKFFAMNSCMPCTYYEIGGKKRWNKNSCEAWPWINQETNTNFATSNTVKPHFLFSFFWQIVSSESKT